MRMITLTALCILSCAALNGSYAQGCSDAGFCSIGNLAPKGTDTAAGKTKHTFSIQLPAGIGDDDVFVFTPGIEYSSQLSSRWNIQAKLTANYASGKLGNIVGAGDLFLSGTHLFEPDAKWKVSVTLGTKLPLNQGNLKKDGLSLPMQYQGSLGTVDLITGLAVYNNNWQFAAGWQQPLSGINRNNFLPAYWDKPAADNYSPSNDFKRKGDVLLRTSYSFPKKHKWHLNAGLLGIYHLGEDTYIDANISNTPIPITGSKGLTLNVTAAFNYPLSDKISVGLTGGVPLVVRDVRPDGLTRSFVLSPEIRFNF